MKLMRWQYPAAVAVTAGLEHRRRWMSRKTAVALLALCVVGLAPGANAAKRSPIAPCPGQTPSSKGWSSIKMPFPPPGEVESQWGGSIVFGRGLTVAPHPVDPNILFASDGRTVLRSKDAGCTWSEVFQVNEGPNAADPGAVPYHGVVIAMQVVGSPQGATHVVLGVNYGTAAGPSKPGIVRIYRSSDLGDTWGSWDEGLPPGPQIRARGKLFVSPVDPETAFVLLETYGGHWQLWGRSPGGLWELRDFQASGAIRPPYCVITSLYCTAGDLEIVFDPSDSATIWAHDPLENRGTDPSSDRGTGSGLFKSADGGRSWTYPAVDLYRVQAIDFYKDAKGVTRMLLSGQNSKVLESTDGGQSFTPISVNLESTFATLDKGHSVQAVLYGDGPQSLVYAHYSEKLAQSNNETRLVFRYDMRTTRWVLISQEPTAILDVVRYPGWKAVFYGLSDAGDLLRYAGKL